MKIAVTGATGHVGVNLVVSLVKKGYDVQVLIHKNPNIFNGLAIKKVSGDLLEPESLLPFCRGADIVVHLAAVISIGGDSDKVVYDTNVEGTKNLVLAAKKEGVRKLIHFSSIHALKQEPFDIPMDETREIVLDSKLAYERTKAIAESWVSEQQSDDFDVVIVNPTSIIGPQDHSPSLIGEFMCGAYRGAFRALIPGGYDWVDVRDVVDATIAIIEKSECSNRYLLSGNWLSVVSLADLFMSVSDKKKKFIILPTWVARIGIPFMYLYARITKTQPVYTTQSLDILQSGHRNISSEKARKELGFNPRPLSDTLKDSYLWFKENKYI